MKWRQLSEEVPAIAVLPISDLEEITFSIARFFGNDPVGYSGVILGNDGTTSCGESVEKSCYEKGGYKFLLRRFENVAEGISPILVETVRLLLVSSAESYATSVGNPPGN